MTSKSQSAQSSEGHRSRLRRRFEQSGFSGFNDYETIELILTLCIPRRDVKQPAKALIQKFGNLHNILNATPSDLRQIPGIGEITPISLKIIREIVSLYLQQSAEEKSVLDNSEKLEAFWQSRLSHLKYEVFEVAYLDNRYCLIKNGVERLQEGTIDHTVVYPRQVMLSALNHSAASIVLAHNHPTGIAQPSQHDIQLTKALIQAASTLNIEIVDHIIIANKEIFSFRRMGLIH